MRKEKRTITEVKEVDVYVADDGKEFSNEYDCKSYERDLERIKRCLMLEDMEIDARNVAPLDDDFAPSESSDYYWYRVRNIEEKNALSEYWNMNIPIMDYPAIICVEVSNSGDCYYDMKSIKHIVERFFNHFDIDVTFTERKGD